ncbi:MAG: rubredoxin [Treponema sp.]|nr:rubredoxin [Treponema sp.]
MQKYNCSICGFVYDPAQGDPSKGIKLGTAFEDVSSDWVCPTCGLTKDAFYSEGDGYRTAFT